MQLTESQKQEALYDMFKRGYIRPDRKVSGPSECSSRTDFSGLPPAGKQAIESLRIVEGSSDFFENQFNGREEQFVILKTPGKGNYFFVDTQGYDYARYTSKLVNFAPESKGFYTIKKRLELFIGNCEVQNGVAMFDDIEKLENILELMKQGKSIHDEFEFVK